MSQPKLSFLQDDSGPVPAAAPVAVLSTPGRLFHTIQVWKLIIFYV